MQFPPMPRPGFAPAFDASLASNYYSPGLYSAGFRGWNPYGTAFYGYNPYAQDLYTHYNQMAGLRSLASQPLYSGHPFGQAQPSFGWRVAPSPSLSGPFNTYGGYPNQGLERAFPPLLPSPQLGSDFAETPRYKSDIGDASRLDDDYDPDEEGPVRDPSKLDDEEEPSEGAETKEEPYDKDQRDEPDGDGNDPKYKLRNTPFYSELEDDKDQPVISNPLTSRSDPTFHNRLAKQLQTRTACADNECDREIGLAKPNGGLGSYYLGREDSAIDIAPAMVGKRFESNIV